MKQLKKTKIIITLWPASDTPEMIEQLYLNWANIVRLNYSHSNYDYYSKILNSVKKLNSQWKTNLGILTDTKWPEIRTKTIEDEIEIEANEVFILTTTLNESASAIEKSTAAYDYKSASSHLY